MSAPKLCKLAIKVRYLGVRSWAWIVKDAMDIVLTSGRAKSERDALRVARGARNSIREALIREKEKKNSLLT